jgi:hypothetical protein
MKYKPGDGLLFKVADGLFLSGIVFDSSRHPGKYVIALAMDRLGVKPPPGWTAEAVLTEEHGMEDQVFFMVQTFVMDEEYVDGHSQIELAYKIPLTGLVSHGGFAHLDNLSGLKAFHDDEMLIRRCPPPVMPPGMTLRKTHQTVAEMLASIPPTNEFPIVKLYKEDEAGIHYWQLMRFGEDRSLLVEHWGILGAEGLYNEMKDLSIKEVREAYNFAIRRKKEDGFEPRAPKERMILQFASGHKWGDMNDLDFRHEMEEYIDRYLFWSGNGSVSGGDIGSGTLNIFFEVISLAPAVDTVVGALEERKIKKGFVIAHRRAEGKIDVVYPQGYKGEFHY